MLLGCDSASRVVGRLTRVLPAKICLVNANANDNKAVGLAQLHPSRFFLDTWNEVDAEARKERNAYRKGGARYDYRALWVLCFGAALLALKDSLGDSGVFVELANAMAADAAPGSFWAELPSSPYFALWGHAWWSGWRVLAYFALPALFIRLVLQEKVADHGLRTKGLADDLWLYGLALGVVLVLVIGASQSEAFVSKYPFYEHADRSWFDLLAWEAMYVAQFFALEFFFRGHWLEALRRPLGSYAIFVMVVPYCMVHFGKPLPETLGAIVAGVVLGTLALKTRSIWSGFLIHSSVGIAMDFAAIIATGSLPATFWPT